MKILVVNPNTSSAATAVIEGEAVSAASEGTRILARTAPSGPSNIGSVEQSDAQAPVVVEMIEKEASDVDGAVIAAFSDPGLALVRSRLDLPVVGIGESSLIEAARVGSRVVIVSSNPNNAPLYQQCAARIGIADKLVNIRYLDMGGRALLEAISDRERLASAAISAAREALSVDGAEAVIVAGGPLAGLAREVAPHVDVPVLDCVACAVSRIERLVAGSAS